jgi:hypothetical protein
MRVKFLALAIGAFVAAVGLVGVVSPQGLQTIARYSMTSVGLYVVAAIRLAFGVILFRAAAASRAPRVLRVVGVFAFVAGLVTPFLGVDRAHAIFDWWSGQSPVFLRLWPGLAVVFGVFIVWAVTPSRR